MKRHYIILIATTLVIVSGYCFVAIQTETGPALGIEIDLGKPASIIWPCEIDFVGDHAEKGLRIPPNVGRGWLEEAGGSATYKFFIPDDNEYYLWFYCKWHDECTNAVYARIDDSEKTIVGNDPVYDQWHWVRGFPTCLQKGTHTLILANHSDNVEFQKVVLMNSKSTGPDSSEITFSDIFYDGFDGCDEGNFSSWQVVKGLWQVMDPKSQSCAADNALKGISKEEAMIVFFDETWQNYSLDMEIKTEIFERGESEIGVCFGLQDRDNYYMLSFIPKDNQSMVTATLTRQSSGTTETIKSFDLSWPQQDWCRLQIRENSGVIEFKLGDQNVKMAQLYRDMPVHGGIGFYLKGNVVVYFDNIHVRRVDANKDISKG